MQQHAQVVDRRERCPVEVLPWHDDSERVLTGCPRPDRQLRRRTRSNPREVPTIEQQQDNFDDGRRLGQRARRERPVQRDDRSDDKRREEYKERRQVQAEDSCRRDSEQASISRTCSSRPSTPTTPNHADADFGYDSERVLTGCPRPDRQL